MTILKHLIFVFAFTALSGVGSVSAQTARISIDNYVGIPAGDLSYNGVLQRPEQARELERKMGENYLSTLDPVVLESGVWEKKQIESLDTQLDNMAIDSGDEVQYQSSIKSNSGFFKFNVLTKNNKFITLYLDKKLHTTLIRKNILRKLGFKVPSIKHLPTLKVTFTTIIQKEAFLSKMLRGAEGRTSRWIDQEKSTELTLHFRDIAAQELSDEVLYNFAMGLPSGDLNSRAVRSLIVPFALVDIKESVNKLSWTVGRLGEGNKVELPHFVVNNNFQTTTYNDVLWIARKMAKLNRSDFEEIVQKAYLPKAAELLIVEKLLSRARHLYNLLEIPFDEDEYSFDPKVSEAPYLLKGKINKIDWTDHGFASEFAAGDSVSPFKDFRFYIYSMLQSIGIDSVIARANEELRAFSPNDARMDLAKKEFDEGLNHFVKTGEFIDFPVSAWTTPIVNGSLILSRSIVVGNYLGTDNRVQFADTFGYAVSLGAMMGLENIDFADQVLLNASARYVKTYTHLKPLKSLKDVFKEEYKNLIVPLLKRNLRKTLSRAQKNHDGSIEEINSEEEQTFYSEVVKDISKILGVGESLIITEKIVPKFGGKGKVPLMNSGATLGLGATFEHIKVKRLQILRKDAKTIQIYDDRGYGNGIDYTISLDYFLPIIRFEYKPFKGKYQVRNYVVNLDIDPKNNPHFIDGIAGLNSIMTTGSSEVLESLVTDKKNVVSSEIEAEYSDKYSKLAFLFWRRQSNSGYSHMNVTTSTGLDGEYISYHDTERSGLNWESFTKDIIKYGLSKLSNGDDLKWANSIWGNPANSIKGNASTIESHYEAQIKKEKVKKEYMSLGIRYEGWSEGKSDLIEIMNKLNDKFTVALFSEEQVEKISTLYMYDIHATVNLYKNGVRALKSLKRDDLIRHANHYDSIKSNTGRGCSEKRIKTYSIKDNGVSKKIETCGTMRKAIYHIKKCSLKKSRHEETKCWLTVGKDIFKSTPFSYFSNLVGKNNYYLEGEVNGFRTNSEILNKPIKSNGFGRKHPGYPYGIIKKVQQRIGVQAGEFSGEWLRERP
jgi:hypothetical protein